MASALSAGSWSGRSFSAFLYSFQGLYVDVTLQEVIFDEVLRLGHEVLEKMDPGLKRESLETTLRDLRTRWDDVYSKTTERQSQLDEITPLAQKYEDASKEFLPWLHESEIMVSECHLVICEKHALSREQQLVKVCFSGSWRIVLDTRIDSRPSKLGQN